MGGELICDCGHLQAHHDWSSSAGACVGQCSLKSCRCRAFTNAALPYATPTDGSPPACVDHEGKTARERLAEIRVTADAPLPTAFSARGERIEQARSIEAAIAGDEDPRCECGHPDVLHGISPSGDAPCGDPSCACQRYLPKSWRRLRVMYLELRAEEKRRRETPIPMRIICPRCGELHVDVGEYATKVHATHACQACGEVWRPAVVPTVGVHFLPGFKNEEKE